ncbi:MAG: YbjQ family protein [Candidatus Brockarchaeota archaeon]|nr:YbjQ family protein [Candidatus Brockarchaeota archaeon]
MDQMIVSTTPIIPGYKVVRVLGVVSGMTARTRGIGGKFVAGIQSIVGGEVSAFTEEIVKARDEALRRVMDQARALGANAIIGLDFETSEIFETVVLISATGTAAVIEQENLPPPP